MTDYSNREFTNKVTALVGSEYTFLEHYESNSKTPKLLCRHNVCEHEWVVPVRHFLYSGTRCPVCTKHARKLARSKTQEQFDKEITALVGGEYTFLERYQGTDTKIKCRHNSCGHIYPVTPDKFRSGRRCPQCALVNRGSKSRKSAEQFEKQFYSMFSDYELITPYVKQYTPVEIKHKACGKVFKRIPKVLVRTKTLCCDFCEIQSFGEFTINEFLASYNVSYQREYRFNDCRNKKPLPFDFAILSNDNRVVGLIEYDGRQHYEATGGYFGGEAYLSKRKRLDQIKSTYCSDKHIPLLRVQYGMTEQEIQEQVAKFVDNLER